MIPHNFILQWRASSAPWTLDALVEQDLVLTRALIEIFSDETLSSHLALRGGTALNKLFFKTLGRYSEDIDLVQVVQGDNGPIIDKIRKKLDPWIGIPKREIGKGITTITYKFTATDGTPLKLKIEMNTREHRTLFDLIKMPVVAENPWFDGRAVVQTYNLNEMLGTKLRALYQRRKGRDLYDLWFSSQHFKLDSSAIVQSFRYYIESNNLKISREEFRKNMDLKIANQSFLNDIKPLLSSDIVYDPLVAYEWFKKEILVNL